MIASACPAGNPPAAGWMDCFALCRIEGYSVSDVAAKLNLPPEKVRQACNQVLTWLGTNQPLMAERSKEEALKLSEAIAREQLEHLYAEAMEAWKESKQEEVRTRQEGIMARTTRTIKTSHGKICYLNAATKISEALLAIPIRYVPAWMLEGKEASAPIKFQLDAGERARRQQQQARRARSKRAAGGAPNPAPQAAQNPPLEDCSAFLEATYGGTNPLEGAFDAMRREVETTADFTERLQSDPRAFAKLFAPVQALETDGSESGFDEDDSDLFDEDEDAPLQPVQVAAEAPSLLPKSKGRPLNRKERRARQKLLEKARRRKAR